MNTNTQEIRDPETNRLLGIYCRGKGVFEVKQKGRVLQIRFPPDTPVQFSFRDSDDMDKPAV